MKDTKFSSFRNKVFQLLLIVGLFPVLLTIYLSLIPVRIELLIALPSLLIFLLSLAAAIYLNRCLRRILANEIKSTVTKYQNIDLELTAAREIIESYKARVHEFANKLHVISGLLQLGSYEEANRYVMSNSNNEMTFLSVLGNIKVNAVSALLIGKSNKAEKTGIKLEIDCTSNLSILPEFFEEDVLVTVLGNLLENAFDAVAYNVNDPIVLVSIKQRPYFIDIEVKDNGQGISETIKERIFEPGFTTKINGTGYGLANVKKMVDMAKGNINFLSSEKGTAFYVTIPCDSLS